LKISRRLIFFLFSLALVLAFPGCGDGGDEQSLASLDHTDTDFIRAKEAQINALEEVLGRAGDGTKPDIIVVNFQRELMYSKSLGLQAFPENVGHSSPQSAVGSPASTTVRAQEDSGGEAFRRVPTKFGTADNPYTTIGGSVKLPKSEDLEWIDQGGEAAYNYLGIQHRSLVTLDAGILSDSISAHVRGNWYAFAAYTPVGGAYTPIAFQGWPQGGIPGESDVTMRLDAIEDADPSTSGNQPGFLLVINFNGQNGGAVAVFEGVSGIPTDGVDTAVRRVSSIIWKSEDKDPRMCDVRWSNVIVGEPSNGFHPFSPDDLNTQPPGEVFEDKLATVSDDTPYSDETLDLRCGNAVGLVIDTTGSMGGEIGAVKLALTTFIDSPFSELVSQWTLSTFKDSSISYGLTSDKDTIKSWVFGLRASGGGDCPEDSLGAVSLTAETIKDISASKSLILVTDASPRTSNPAEVTARLNELDITLYVLLTGDCVASTTSAREVRAQSILSARDVFSQMAKDTGGKYVYLPGGSAADFTAVLEDFFEDAATGGSDNVPPTIDVTVAPETIWPPNHKMVEVTYDLNVVDNQDPNPSTEVVGVAVSEPDDVQGSGNTSPDYEITSDGRVFVRAERSGTGQRRIYTVTFKAEDASGNASFASADVVVPHDKGNGKK